jgi:predicted ATPase
MAPERMLRQMAEAVEALTAGHRALVLAFDDLQWSGHATLELIDVLVRRQLPARLLIVGAYRTGEVRAPDHPLLVLKQDLQLRGRCEEIALEPLAESAVASYFAARFAGSGGTLAASLQRLPDRVHARTGGHPLFMAAVADDLVRRGVVARRRGRWDAPEPVHEVDLPASVRQFIGQEIERLGPEHQQMLEAASVAGREFSVATVAAASDADAEAIEARCTDLVRRQRFLRPAGVGEWPDGTVAARFAFRHDLYREAVSERLGTSRRRALHLRIGEWREQAYGERAKEIAPTLAVHFEEAGDWLRAARYRRHASEQAQQRHAPREAAEHARRGVTLIEREPPSQERIREELLLQQALAVAVTTARGFAVPELSRVYARASELCNEVEDLDSSISVLCGIWNLALNQGDCRRASDVADQLLSLGQQRREPVALLQARDAVASTRFFMGEPAAAMRHCERGLELYDVRHNHHLADVYGDPGVLCHVVAGLGAMDAGLPGPGTPPRRRRAALEPRARLSLRCRTSAVARRDRPSALRRRRPRAGTCGHADPSVS